jgi:TRAP-type C4-dicarboxylate transport system permease small subunit
VEAPEELGVGTSEGGLLARIRGNPWLAVALAAGAILVLAWIGWAIYVAADRGAREALGVLIAWPALVAAAALVALPFIGVYLLVRSRDAGDSQASDGEQASPSEEQKDSEEAEATSPG